MKADINQKKRILEFLVKNNIRQIDNVGKVINRYYLDMDTVLDVVNNDKAPKELLE